MSSLLEVPLPWSSLRDNVSGLAMVEFLSRHEVLQVLVVHPDFHRVTSSFQKVPLLFQRTDNSKHLFVMDLVVPFHWRQGFAIESH